MKHTPFRAGALLAAAIGPAAACGDDRDECADRPVRSGRASLTTYTSYAPCCPDNPNYDPDADKTECEEYSACSYSGGFAAIGHQTYEWVQAHSIVAFFDACDPEGRSFEAVYAGRMVRLEKDGATFDALIADTCADTDCEGCCSENARPSGFLVDLEYWTAVHALGSDEAASGSVGFEILDDFGIWPGCEEPCGTVDPVW